MVGEWEEWCTVTVTVTISTTAPSNKKQRKVGIKYLAKILWGSCQGCSLLYLMGHQRNNARGGRG